MMKVNKNYIVLISIILFVCVSIFYFKNKKNTQNINNKSLEVTSGTTTISTSKLNIIAENSLSIAYMRKQNYPGSDLKIDRKLLSTNDYNEYLASYISDGLKIFGILAVPNSKKPTSGWPAIIFNHGYIRPSKYVNTEYYIPYIRNLAKNGYLVFMPDYRGNGNSEGQPESQYFAPDYTIDAMNALSTIKRYSDVNSNKIGMWGHSDGGNVILRSLVIDNNKDIKVSVIWGGVVSSYKDLTVDWQSMVTYHQPKYDLEIENNHLKDLLRTYGSVADNPTFWNSIDPTNFLTNITAPIQLHTGGEDEEVPVSFSVELKDKLTELNKTVEYYNYPRGDHNISSPNFSIAMKRTIEFFDKYLK